MLFLVMFVRSCIVNFKMEMNLLGNIRKRNDKNIIKLFAMKLFIVNISLARIMYQI